MARERTSGEVREYLLGRLGEAVRRPGSSGGEPVLGLLFDALEFLGRGRRPWRSELAGMGAWSAAGVGGAVELVLGERAEDLAAAVYAELARRRGWLAPDRELSPAQYYRLRAALPSWCARDRVRDEVLAEFGPPSVAIGGGTCCGGACWGGTLAYGTARADYPLVCFRLCGAGGSAGAGLVAAWCGDQPLREEGLLFTPWGAARRAGMCAELGAGVCAEGEGRRAAGAQPRSAHQARPDSGSVEIGS